MRQEGQSCQVHRVPMVIFYTATRLQGYKWLQATTSVRLCQNDVALLVGRDAGSREDAIAKAGCAG